MAVMAGTQIRGTATSELGEFLRTRRAAIRPEDVGLRSFGARRVPGLRREELAQLAGVSPTYYTRLEQSASHNASAGVIDALARALSLSPDEHEHLRNLAKPVRATRRQCKPVTVRPAAKELVQSMTNPAVILDRCNDVLAWNSLAHRLFGGVHDFDQVDVLTDRPNLARMFFLEKDSAELYVDHQRIATDITAFLRYSSGRHPDDPQLTELVGELSVKSDEFACLWAQHLVQDCGYGVKRLHHPLVGRLDLNYQVTVLPDSGQRLGLYHAVVGSPAADALALLARDTDDADRHQAYAG